MIRFYLKLLAPLFILFAVLMLLIRAQPYDDHDLRALLTPDNCQMPCFMGIRPGVTTMDKAEKILKVSGWVNSVYQGQNSDDDSPFNVMGVFWSGRQPYPIDPDWAGMIATDKNAPHLVTNIQFNLQERMLTGDLYLILGRPTEIKYSGDSYYSGQHHLDLFLVYSFNQMIVELSTDPSCPITLESFLKRPINKIIYDTLEDKQGENLGFMQVLQGKDC